MAGFLDAGVGRGGGSPPEADGPDDPERGSTPPGDDRQEVEGEPGPDPDLADDETQDPDPATLERTLDQLRGEGGPAVDRDSVRLDYSDIPVAPGQWPLGYPIQGLPRAAVTLSLNYVYDDERDQWVRDTGNSGGGGGVEIVAEGTETVSPDTDSVVFTGVLGFDRLVRATASLASLSNVGRSTDISEGAVGQFRNDIVYVQEYDPVFNEWLIRIANEVGRPIDVRWALLEFSPG